jgi:hypothetical protein
MAIQWQGGWSGSSGVSLLTYYSGDIVFYNNVSYVVQKNVVSIPIGSPPPPDDMSNWDTMATGGSSGVAGTSGTSGVDGTSGTNGTSGTAGTSGNNGQTLTPLGVEENYGGMTSSHPNPNPLDTYILQDTSELWIYDPTSTAKNDDGWVNMGAIQGPTGLTGESGTSGTSGTSGIDGTSGTSGMSITAGSASYATFSGTASYSNLSGTASYSNLSGTASYATFSALSGTSSYATFSGTASYANLSGTASWATFSGTASFARLSATSSYATFSAFSGTASWATFSGTASFSNLSATASWATFSGTASFARLSSTASYATFSGTASVSNYSKGRYAYWSPWVSVNPSGMGATFTAANYTARGEDIQLTTTATDGQNARINWFSENIDWKQDFKVELGYYCGKWTTLADTGDGFCLYMGTNNINVDTYANAADGALKFRLFTYNGNISPNQGGASFFVGSSKGPQGKTENNWSVDKWLRFTIEVCTDKITNKRMATAYFRADTGTSDYAGKYFIAAMDVTSWVPSGNNFGFYCSTGGARANQYINSIQFEAL